MCTRFVTTRLGPAAAESNMHVGCCVYGRARVMMTHARRGANACPLFFCFSPTRWGACKTNMLAERRRAAAAPQAGSKYRERERKIHVCVCVQ